MKKILYALTALFMTTSFVKADFTGKWLVESKKAIVDIQPCGDSLCGTIIWGKGERKFDNLNENESLRGREIIGIKMIWDFKKQGNKWVDGKIYNPNDGK